MKHAVFFYARETGDKLVGKTDIGQQLHDQDIANSLARALITDMRREYTPRPEDTYVFFDVRDFRDVNYNDLGNAMRTIFERLLETYEKVLIVGSDIPGITHESLHESFTVLNTYDTTLIPTGDGGYGLIGMNTFVDLFSGINNWNSRSMHYRLAQETRWLAERHGKTLFEQEREFDIDDVADIQRLWRFLQAGQFPHMKETKELLRIHKKTFGLT